MDQDSCFLGNGNDVSLMLTSNAAKLKSQQGTLTLDTTKAELKGNGSTITCDADGIKIDPAGKKVTFGQFTWDDAGGALTRPGVLKLDSNGMVKIG